MMKGRAPQLSIMKPETKNMIQVCFFSKKKRGGRRKAKKGKDEDEEKKQVIRNGS